MSQVLVYSRGGNTRKLADAIAGELGVKAADVKAASLDKGNGVLFLGSGCYAGKPGKGMMDFIEANDFKGRMVALFGTSANGHGKQVGIMEEALKQKGAKILGSYESTGQFLMFIRRGHPNDEDVVGAKKFAGDLAKLG
ncbi:MAG TPA: flavodoxin family protein [Methanocella sp.]|uniref:flavodoxin family protein n=1 Tax=Methanocella sp. TaxID=2052833 RepID=UPI002D015458|nr:flavodoxin family protein [Methanocella sp.]HTY91396.1 flavodoxin family protein [Methanocella sp.]